MSDRFQTSVLRLESGPPPHTIRKAWCVALATQLRGYTPLRYRVRKMRQRYFSLRSGIRNGERRKRNALAQQGPNTTSLNAEPSSSHSRESILRRSACGTMELPHNTDGITTSNPEPAPLFLARKHTPCFSHDHATRQGKPPPNPPPNPPRHVMMPSTREPASFNAIWEKRQEGLTVGGASMRSRSDAPCGKRYKHVVNT